MFSVVCMGSSIGKTLISNGVVIGNEGVAVQFKVTVPDIPVPLIVNFTLLEDAQKTHLTAEVTEIIDNAVSVKFINSVRNGASGIPMPISLVAFGDVDLQMLFHIERSNLAPTFLIFYSFYEAPAGWGV